MRSPELADYQRIARTYEHVLLQPTEPRGRRLELPFTQVARLLAIQSKFNASLPEPFLQVAKRIREHDAPTMEHFSYDENRQFFLSDLFDYIRLRAVTETLA